MSLPQLLTIDLNGTTLSYVETGEGEPLVLVHGAGGDYRSWAPQLEGLGGQCRVISYSRRYHFPDTAEVPDATYTVALHVADLVAFLRGLRLGPVHLLGHSYGGVVAALTARDHPDLVRSLILSEPGLGTVLADRPGGAEAIAEQHAAWTVVCAACEAGDWPRAIDLMAEAVNGPGGASRLTAAARMVLLSNARTLAPMLRGTAAHPVTFALADAEFIGVPALVIHGAETVPYYRMIAEEMACHLPQGRLAVIPDAAHSSSYHNPEAFNAAVATFLAEIEPCR